ncbi:AIPR family protein [Micromonospora sp. NBC_01392]|uniref:AIPR family protein n=1 Tax=Micromonospora sp. NBC_01392 TaxID=2903588 RepID=UPI003250CAA9
MTTISDLAAFAEDLRVEVNQRLSAEPEMMVGDMFVRVVAERLIADGSLEDLDVCYLRQQGRPALEISGYNISSDGTILDLVTRETEKSGETITRTRVVALFRRATAFAQACHEGLHKLKEESAPVYDMAQRIHAEWAQLRRIRVFLLTDGRATLERIDESTLVGLPVTYQVWDIARLHRLAASGRVQEEIVIDLEEMGHAVPVLESPEQSDGYRCLLAVIPGQLLADLYAKHHSRILQRNVRAYLQARGRVNREMHTTIREQPGRFLAYNNGISATATDVEVERREGAVFLKRLHDLQIVNGGQTTASLHHASTNRTLDGVHVMAKITVVPEAALNELVPRISRYANSQNAIRPADFEANGPFHIGLEHVSRVAWAPARPDSTRETHWYYERVRGQYQVERSRQQTAARKKRFEGECPPNQRFSKTDAAKYEMTYLMRPHTVSLGAEKCFQEWTLECKLDERDAPTLSYFRHLVAKGILFQGIRTQVLKLRLGGYPGQTAAYVMALIVERLGGQVDLDLVWRLQQVPEQIEATVPHVTKLVRDVIISPPGSANVTEWCKKEDCWNRVRAVSWSPPADLAAIASAPRRS